MVINKDYLVHLHVKQGDITKETTDVIVNAANTSLLGGGGVDGAIHRAAGPELLLECRVFGGCKTGEARITKGYNLKAQYVIHTPGPVYRGGSLGEKILLENSYRNSLLLAREHKLTSIAFPAISTGVYHYPKEEACEIAIMTTLEFFEKYNYVLDVNFVLFDSDNYELYTAYLKKLERDVQ